MMFFPRLCKLTGEATAQPIKAKINSLAIESIIALERD